MKQLVAIFLWSIACTTWAQKPTVPTPATAQTQAIAITNATIHIGDGTVLEQANIVFEQGKITQIGKNINLPPNAQTIDARGKQVYPGFIAVNSTIGLTEIGAIRATNDRNEVGELNPNVRSLIAYNTDSHVIPTLRSNGLLLAQVVPQGDALITGTSSVVQLDAWRWEDAAYKTDDAIYMNWSRMYKTEGWDSPEGPRTVQNEEYNQHLAQVKDLFDQAKAYCNENQHNPQNNKLAAMCGLFDGSKKLYIRCNYSREIIDAVTFAQQYGVKMVLVGGDDAWKVTDLLRTHNVSVVINRTHNLPNRTDEDVDISFKLPKLLQDAGVGFCLTSGSGWDAFWDVRNLPFEAGTAAAYGLTKEQALSSITLSAAKVLGIDATVGSLAVGKDANILVSTGDILDMRTSKVEKAFIQGREIDLDNKQKALYRKFAAKYGIEVKE